MSFVAASTVHAPLYRAKAGIFVLCTSSAYVEQNRRRYPFLCVLVQFMITLFLKPTVSDQQNVLETPLVPESSHYRLVDPIIAGRHDCHTPLPRKTYRLAKTMPEVPAGPRSVQPKFRALQGA